MKKFFTLALITVFGLGLVFPELAVASRSFYFSGRGDSEAWEKYKASLAQPGSQSRTNYRRTYRYTAPRNSSYSTTRTRTNTLRDNSRRSSTGIRATRQSGQVTSTRKPTAYKVLEADNTNFQVRVPIGFAKSSDNLSANSGSLILKSETEKIEIMATSDRCDSEAGAGFQDCYTKFWQAEQKALKAKYPKGFVLKNQDLLWNTSVGRSALRNIKDQQGRYMLVHNGKKRIGMFLFFEPSEQHYVWKIHFEGPSNGALLRNFSSTQKILLSLFQAQEADQSTRKNYTPSNLGRRFRNVSFRAEQARNTNDSTKQRTIMGRKLNFSLSVPKDYVLKQDTLSQSNGKMRITDRLENNTIEIMPTETICESNLDRDKVNRCIKAGVETLIAEFKKAHPQANLLEDRSILLKLIAGANTKENLGHFVHLRETGKRYALIIFREPSQGHLWQVMIHSPESRSGNDILNDSRVLNTVMSSFLFQ